MQLGQVWGTFTSVNNELDTAASHLESLLHPNPKHVSTHQGQLSTMSL